MKYYKSYNNWDYLFVMGLNYVKQNMMFLSI